MRTVTIHEAKTHLSRLIKETLQGEEVVIAKGKTPLVRLTPLPGALPERRLDGCKGLIASISEDFDAPLSDLNDSCDEAAAQSPRPVRPPARNQGSMQGNGPGHRRHRAWRLWREDYLANTRSTSDYGKRRAGNPQASCPKWFCIVSINRLAHGDAAVTFEGTSNASSLNECSPLLYRALLLQFFVAFTRESYTSCLATDSTAMASSGNWFSLNP